MTAIVVRHPPRAARHRVIVGVVGAPRHRVHPAGPATHAAVVEAVAGMRVAADVKVVAEAVAGVTVVAEAGGTRVGSESGNRAVGFHSDRPIFF